MRLRYDGTPALRQSCGNRLRAVRHWYRASQRTLAAASGISRSSLYRYENGLALPQALHLGRLAYTLHTSVEFLLIGENPPSREDFANMRLRFRMDRISGPEAKITLQLIEGILTGVNRLSAARAAR